MNFQPGDILYTKIDNQYHVSKILRIDPFFKTYHITGYAPLDHVPEVKDLSKLLVSIGHCPIAEFTDGIFLTNQPVLSNELDGYLTYLTMTDFGGWLQATKQNPSEVVALANQHYEKAYNLTNEKKFEEAVDSYTWAFETFPLFFEAMDNRAFVKMDMGRWQQAIDDFRLSLIVNPVSVLAEFSIGECYLRMQKYPEAKAQFEKSLRIDPEHKLSQEFLAKTILLM